MSSLLPVRRDEMGFLIYFLSAVSGEKKTVSLVWVRSDISSFQKTSGIMISSLSQGDLVDDRQWR